ncbi:hypothetical protein [Streptomyces sp. NPDC056682]|uniref:hypothetical protein n=1 Tax=Streptomyces sp. NPDC056682 TaxID=3345909 RepID=UPI003685B039
MRVHRTAPKRAISNSANALVRPLEVSWCAVGVPMCLPGLLFMAHSSIRSRLPLRGQACPAPRELEERRCPRRPAVMDPEAGLFREEHELASAPSDRLPVADGQLPRAAREFTGTGGVKRACGDRAALPARLGTAAARATRVA